MAKYSLAGSTVSIDGNSSCVESGDVDLGELNLVEVTCSSDFQKKYAAGTHNACSGSVTINDSTEMSAWLTSYGTSSAIPAAVEIVFTWGDGAAALTVTGYITNVSASVGVDQAAMLTFNFSGSQSITSFGT